MDGLESMGIAIDSAKNLAGSVDVGAAVSKTKVLVIPTNEELSISLQSVDAANIFPPLEAPATKAIISNPNKANTNKDCRALFAHGMEGSYVADEELALLQRYEASLLVLATFAFYSIFLTRSPLVRSQVQRPPRNLRLLPLHCSGRP